MRFFFRNVLIYFEVDKKREIFSRLVSAMKPDGYLLLGLPRRHMD